MTTPWTPGVGNLGELNDDTLIRSSSYLKYQVSSMFVDGVFSCGSWLFVAKFYESCMFLNCRLEADFRGFLYYMDMMNILLCREQRLQADDFFYPPVFDGILLFGFSCIVAVGCME